MVVLVNFWSDYSSFMRVRHSKVACIQRDSLLSRQFSNELLILTYKARLYHQPFPVVIRFHSLECTPLRDSRWGPTSISMPNLGLGYRFFPADCLIKEVFQHIYDLQYMLPRKGACIKDKIFSKNTRKLFFVFQIIRSI